MITYKRWYAFSHKIEYVNTSIFMVVAYIM